MKLLVSLVATFFVAGIALAQVQNPPQPANTPQVQPAPQPNQPPAQQPQVQPNQAPQVQPGQPAQPIQPPPPAGTVLEGQIVRVVGTDQVVLRTADGKEVIVFVTPKTTYLASDQAAVFTDLRPGADVSVNYELRDGRHY